MSLKEDLQSVKKEINTEEQFLEGFVKVERFFKQNKLIIIAAAVIIIVALIAVNVTDYLKEQNKLEANLAFNKVLDNPSDQTALATLKEKNSQLYDVALYLQAQKENKLPQSNVKFLKELSSYQKALEEKNVIALNSVSMQNDFLLKEFAIFNKALILTEEGKYKDAKDTLRLIPQTSKVYELVKLLNHYLLTKV